MDGAGVGIEIDIDIGCSVPSRCGLVTDIGNTCSGAGGVGIAISKQKMLNNTKKQQVIFFISHVQSGLSSHYNMGKYKNQIKVSAIYFCKVKIINPMHIQ
ncbi:hypothetical protein [Paenibacillus phytorum]|uniref:hypothetical protein n=1 Tax=Paenibacillus phytorum TaxID=2654977 RepID=UPI001FEABBBE|nr:hypothetical protein [Paenibacillus phytorum]